MVVNYLSLTETEETNIIIHESRCKDTMAGICVVPFWHYLAPSGIIRYTLALYSQAKGTLWYIKRGHKNPARETNNRNTNIGIKSRRSE